MIQSQPDSVLLTLAQGYVLVSWWKAILLALPLLGWAWFLSNIFDKHASRFLLPQKQWNTIHLIVGVAAVAAAFFVPSLIPVGGIGSFFIGFGAVVVILAIDIGVFIALHNRDERVPEDHKLKLDFSAIEAARAEREAQKGKGEVSMTIRRPDKSVLAAPDKETTEYEVRLAAEEMLSKVFEARGTQLDIEPIGVDQGKPVYAATTLVDGMKQVVEKMRLEGAVKLIDFWKHAAGLDMEDRRRRQKTDFGIDPGVGERRVRLTTQGGRAGPVLHLLFDPDASVMRDFDDLGLSEAQKELVQGWSLERGGLVLLAAPADNGLTTLMNSVMGLHDAYTNVVQSIDIDPQGVIEGVRQTVWDPYEEGPDHPSTIRSILRRDPDVVGISEIPSAESAKEAIGGDLERSRVYAAIRADSALAAIRGFAKAAGDNKAVAKSLKGVVTVRLVRKLCENCRVPYQPAPDMLKKLGLPADRVKRLFKKSGQVIPKNKNTPETCPVCRGSGYLGQVGFFETYPITDEARPLIEKGDWEALRTEFRKQRDLPAMQASALRLVVQGVTSVEEFARLTTPPKPKQSKKKPAPAPKQSAGA